MMELPPIQVSFECCVQHSSMNAMTAFEYHIWKKLDGACMVGLMCVMLVCVYVYYGTCSRWYMLVHVNVSTCTCICWRACTCICWYVYMYMLVPVYSRYMWKNRRSRQINKVHDAVYHKLVVLKQTLWKLYPWHIDLCIEDWKKRVKYRRILLTVYYHLSLTWKNIRDLIGWKEYSTGHICTLYLVF